MSDARCPYCEESSLPAGVPKAHDRLFGHEIFRDMLRKEIRNAVRDFSHRLQFENRGDGTKAIYFNNGNSRISPDDNCWLLQNRIDGKWKHSGWIFKEAKEILDQLPASPADAHRMGYATLYDY